MWKKNVLLIPSLNPDINFVYFLEKFKEKSNINKLEIDIVIVNDGSSKKYDYIFKKIEEKNIIVLKHAVNLGKGRALKTGINYILINIKNFKSIVTADSDGQHSIEDIISCLIKSNKNPNTLILGSRNFGYFFKKNKRSVVPLRSKFGNKSTKLIFKYLLGIDISDTQTGLRAFGKKQAKDFLKVKGEKFEYETNMLIDNKFLGYEFQENPIKTIYVENNKMSHFNPIRDSIAIYTLFLKYVVVSILSFFIDIFLFRIFILSNFSILLSTVTARIISSVFNYILNKDKVFKSFNKNSFFKYYILVIIQMGVSAFSLKLLNSIFSDKNILALKILIDTIIFIINYYVQREWIFKGGK